MVKICAAAEFILSPAPFLFFIPSLVDLRTVKIAAQNRLHDIHKRTQIRNWAKRLIFFQLQRIFEVTMPASAFLFGWLVNCLLLLWWPVNSKAIEALITTRCWCWDAVPHKRSRPLGPAFSTSWVLTVWASHLFSHRTASSKSSSSKSKEGSSLFSAFPVFHDLNAMLWLAIAWHRDTASAVYLVHCVLKNQCPPEKFLHL